MRAAIGGRGELSYFLCDRRVRVNSGRPPALWPQSIWAFGLKGSRGRPEEALLGGWSLTISRLFKGWLLAWLLLVGPSALDSGDAGAAAASSDTRDTGPVDARLSFAIPAQALEEALMAYAKATGVEVFVDHALVVGRRSAPVEGLYGFEAALQQMLKGTGLDFLRAGPRAFTLVASSPPQPPADWAPAWLKDRTRAGFFAALQGAVRQTLCAQPAIAPGQYRAALAVWTSATGQVVEARLLGTGIDSQAGRRLVDSLRGVSIGQSTPAGMEQPVTFVILPRPPDHTGDCESHKSERE